MDGIDTAQIFIWADKDDKEGFMFNSVIQHKMMFHHNPCSHSLRTFAPLFQNLDDNYSVDFELEMSFKDYCKKLRMSHFNNRKNYNKITHNCTHAAKEALELAGIKLNLQPYHLNWVDSSSYLFVPGFILTPYSLFLAAKKYKIAQLNRQEIENTFQIGTKSLESLKIKTSSMISQNVDTITSELKRKLQINPHRADFYLRVLIHTNDLLIQATQHEKIPNSQKEEYQQSAIYFRNRLFSKEKSHFNYYSLLFVFATLGFFKYLKSRNKSPTVKACLAFCVGLAAIAEKFNEYFSKGPKYVANKPETCLSGAMLNLSKEIEDNEEKTDKKEETHKHDKIATGSLNVWMGLSPARRN